MSKKIKVSDCKKISQEYNFEKVIIIGINEIGGCVDEIDMAIATYGSDKEQCKRAETLGQEVCKEAMLDWLMLDWIWE